MLCVDFLLKDKQIRMERKNNLKRIDIHAHILPGVDDGARSLEEASELVKRSRDAGFSAIIATPHYSRRRGIEGYEAIFQELKEKVEKEFPDFELYLGHETYYHEELAERLKEGKACTLAGSRYVLVEFDNGVSFQTIHRAIRRLLTSGYLPIIAHMERYYCLREPKNLQNIYGSGCYLQMNYESLEGRWFQSEVRWCRNQVKEGNIHFLGTDMHRTDYRPPETEKAMKWLESHVNEDIVRKITFENAMRVIRNEKIS